MDSVIFQNILNVWYLGGYCENPCLCIIIWIILENEEIQIEQENTIFSLAVTYLINISTRQICKSVKNTFWGWMVQFGLSK